ncbi:MAG: hypothetical protein PF484_07145 [Bacteroidales bacterium]|jgi:hypothetical protein|nr:hypothetical protein [Bacteroidales bacterium]
MKRFLYLIFIIGLVITSCNKPPIVPQPEDVVFHATANSYGLKSSNCDNPVADYALITINTVLNGVILENTAVTKTVDVFYLEGNIYTNTLKLDAGNFAVTQFILMSTNFEGEDIVVMASPIEGADYEKFVADALPLKFSVGAFLKNQVPIQVLCFTPTDISEFGFSWFAIDQITVREFCFFGDICIEDYFGYTGSLYEEQQNGLVHDMPAIFTIDVYRNRTPVSTPLVSYNNEYTEDGSDWFGEGAPLCVQYPDFNGIQDNFEFVLSILVKVDDSFVYKPFHTWISTDDGALINFGETTEIDISDDDILDFVLGDCVPDADLILPPFPDTPATPEAVVRSICFDGDICVDVNSDDYSGSAYDGMTTLDGNMPAIFKIDVKHNNVSLGSYSNLSTYGTDLCVNYTDYPDVVDKFEFALSILVIDGTTFVYKEFKTWTIYDAQTFPNMGNVGSASVMDFVLGNCAIGDINLPPYTNPNPPTVVCGECDGDVSSLTLQYIGALNNPFVKVMDDKNEEVLFVGYVSKTVPFTFIGLKRDNKMGKTINIYVYDINYNSLNVNIHTSCSQDIYAGMTFGDFYVVAGESSDGGALCSIELPTDPEPSPFDGDETAFGYGGPAYATCFLNDNDAPDNSRWGWTNGQYSASTTKTYHLDLWAGAADCDQTKGYYVGTVTFTYINGTVAVTYNIIDGVELEAIHLYVGNDKYPLNGLVSTVAPGKFTYIDDDASDGGIDTYFTISGLSGAVYIIAHADVKGD